MLNSLGQGEDYKFSAVIGIGPHWVKAPPPTTVRLGWLITMVFGHWFHCVESIWL